MPDPTATTAAAEMTTGHVGGPPDGLPPTAGRFVLREEVGRGGMGVVVRADDPDLTRPLAVKVLLAGAGDGSAGRRFLDEARLTARLQHPNIPPVHEVGTLPDGRPFFAMKLIEGRTLAELLAARAAPAEGLPRFVAVFEQVCQAVGYAHAQGVIHRDLKPGNVMVGAFGEVQVMDWGLAVEAGGAGEGVSGTPAFMAPEQARGDALDARADVFGLGGVLCAVLTGRAPYDGGNALKRAMAGDVSEALSRLDGCGADPELIALARRCLSPKKEDRPADAGEVARAVAAYAAGVQERLRASEQERARAEVRLAEAAKRRRLAAGLAAAVLAVLALAGVGAAAWQRQRAAEARRVARAAESAGELLDRAESALAAMRWGEAEALTRQASDAVDESRSATSAERLARADKALALGKRLDELRRERLVLLEGGTMTSRLPKLYREAFDAHRLSLEDVVSDESALLAREAVLAALDDWAVLEPDATTRESILTAARKLDPGAWQDRFRDPAARGDRAALQRLAGEAAVDRLPPGTLAALGELMDRAGGDPLPLLRQARDRRPGDFWLCFNLGVAVSRLDPASQGEAVASFEAARSLRPDSVQVACNLGQALVDSGRLLEGERVLKEVLARDAEFPAAWGNLARAYLSLGRLDEAIDAGKKAVALLEKTGRPAEGLLIHNTFALIHEARGEARLTLEAYRRGVEFGDRRPLLLSNLGHALRNAGHLKEGERVLKEASEAAERALARNPRDGTALNVRARIRRTRGDAKGTLADALESVRLMPSVAYFWNDLGEAYRAAGRSTDAEAAYRQALELYQQQGAGNSTRAGFLHQELADLAVSRGRVAEGVELARMSVDLAPKSLACWGSLCYALSDQGDRPELRKAATRASEIARERLKDWPDDPSTLRSLGNALKYLDRHAEAADALRKAAAGRPWDAYAWTQLAQALARQSSTSALRESLEASLKAIQIAPTRSTGYYHASIAARRLGQTNKAIEYGREAVRLQPDAVNTKVILANALAERGDLEEAGQLMRQVVADRPNYFFGQVTLARIYDEQGQGVPASEHFRQAARLAPGDMLVLEKLADVRARIGDLPGAIATLEKVIESTREPSRSVLQARIKSHRTKLMAHKWLGEYAEASTPDERCDRLLADYRRMEAVLDKKAKVQDAQDALRLAGAATLFAGRSVGAVGLFEECFRLDKAEKGTLTRDRSHWAALAAMTAAVIGLDTPLDPYSPVRAQMRGKAFRWAKDTVAFQRRFLGRGDHESVLASEALEMLRSTPRAIEFRERTNRYLMSGDERNQWDELFAEIDRLLAPPKMPKAER